MTVPLRRRVVFALSAAALLAACATAPRRTGPEWLSGRLAIRVEASDGQPARALSSAFELRGDGNEGELRLTSPLGTSVAQARWAPGEAVLTSSDGERRYADLDALARDTLGEALPLRALPSWLRGRPWPGAPSAATDAGFTQLGWQVELSEFAAAGVLQVSRGAAPAVSLRARLNRDE